MYDYYEEVKDSLVDFLEDEYAFSSDELEEMLLSDWENNSEWDDIENIVTGNDNGSYFCNSYEAREALEGNEELLEEALKEFCMKDNFTDMYFSGEFEKMDVIVRMYVFSSIVDDAIEEVREDLI